MKPLFIEEFLPKQVLNLCYSYCVLKFGNMKEFKVDAQTSSLCGKYGDILMEALMDASTPVIEQNVGKKLWPTYSYLRVYDKGSDLKIHIDRPACEYSVALCLGSDPVDKPYEIFVGERDDNSDYKYYYEEDYSYQRVRIDHKYEMVPNNALIFKGRENIHWREVCTHDHFITVFLHYVDQEGPYKDSKFDNRPTLGSFEKK